MDRYTINYFALPTIILIGACFALMVQEAKKNKWTVDERKLIWLNVIITLMRQPPRGIRDGSTRGGKNRIAVRLSRARDRPSHKAVARFTMFSRSRPYSGRLFFLHTLRN